MTYFTSNTYQLKREMLWTEAMMTTKCSLNLTNSDRIMWSGLPKNENSFFMANGFRLPNYVPAEKEKLNYLFFITEHPMMLVTNQAISFKEDVIKVAKMYFSRWRIEEYFRCKKQKFQFENFRVRKLASINALNFYITTAMAFLALISMKSETNKLKTAILERANPIRKKVYFYYYRFSSGIAGILAFAKEGIRGWFKTKRPRYRQLRFVFREWPFSNNMLSVP